MMDSTILVPVDGSTLAEDALPTAKRLARALHTNITLVRVCTPETTHAEPHATPPGSHRGPNRNCLEYLESLARRIRSEHFQVDTLTFVAEKEPATAIVRAAADLKARLVVMSTHGRSGLGRWVYGSVAEEVLRKSSAPTVLVVPGQGTRPPMGERLRVLVSLDGSPEAESALPTALDLIGPDGELVLIQVIEVFPPSLLPDAYLYEDPRPLAEVGRAYLEEVASPLRAQGVTVRTRVEEGHPPSVIGSCASAEGADLVAMATHARTGISRAALGSVAMATVRHGHVPVLLVAPARPVLASGGRELDQAPRLPPTGHDPRHGTATASAASSNAAA